MELKCPYFNNGDPIPEKYTCLGENINPPLEFINVPQTAQSLVLIIEEVDAATKPWIHWLVFNIRPSVRGIEEGCIPKYSMEGLSSNKTNGYEGFRPKYDSCTQNYHFRLFALNIRFYVSDEVDKEDMEVFMYGHIIDQAVLKGTINAAKLKMVS